MLGMVLGIDVVILMMGRLLALKSMMNAKLIPLLNLGLSFLKWHRLSAKKQAMASMLEYLYDKRGKLLRLFWPPFDKSTLEPGYIKGYPLAFEKMVVNTPMALFGAF